MLESISDLFNRSPLGQRYGKFLRTVDVFAKLVGMMTNHCAKEKKDAAALEELKMDAIFQKLGEDEMLDTSTQELLPKFLDAYKQMIEKHGGQLQWNKLPESEQKELSAQMREQLVI